MITTTSFRLPAPREKLLTALAKKTDRSRTWHINKAIEEYLERQELEEKRWTDTLEALESVKEGKMIAGEKVEEWLLSWGNKKEASPPKK